GSFTYGSAPPPPPPMPASAPIDVAATAGDASAAVTWAAPVSSGSFPVTYYRAVSSPAGGTCLVTAPALTCDMTGLANGTTYTVTVQALTGAGWGATSSPSDAVTPQRPSQPSITITGTRGEVRGKPGVIITGTTTGFDTGAILRPWIRFPGQPSYTQGTASILVDVQGGFTWERRTGKTIYISIRSQDNTVKSNRLILRTT
ncbi:MAG: fibronectin type III domain-containing protein, partial [Candidatus Nanopelagicales bacterium]